MLLISALGGFSFGTLALAGSALAKFAAGPEASVIEFAAMALTFLLFNAFYPARNSPPRA